jgi:hypothetical protein
MSLNKCAHFQLQNANLGFSRRTALPIPGGEISGNLPACPYRGEQVTQNPDFCDVADLHVVPKTNSGILKHLPGLKQRR